MEQNISEYNKQGFTIIRGMLSEKEIKDLTAELEAISKKEQKNFHYYYETTEKGRLLRRIENLAKNSRVVNRILYHPKVMLFMKKIFSEDAVLFKDKYNLKLPSGAGFKAHVDGYFYWIDKDDNKRKGWLEYSPNFMSCVIAVDESSKENGCLQIADKSETKKLGNNFDEIVSKFPMGTPEVPDNLMKGITLHDIELSPGDVAFFDWKCIHASGKNNSNLSRRVLYSTYNPISAGNHYDLYFMEKQTSKQTNEKKALG